MTHCGECKMDFSKPFNLRVHVKRKHPDKLETLAPLKRNPGGTGNHSCKECNKCFTYLRNLRFHVKQKHSDKLEGLAPIDKKNYKCKQCDRQFDVLKQLIEHESSHTIIKLRKCPLCQYKDSTNMLVHHFKNDHSIEVINETIEFDSVKDFQDWKSRTEAETFASFVKTGGTRKSQKHTRTEYLCHRSGDFVPKGNNIRRLKICGSNKIGGYCPASMIVVTSNEKCTVHFCRTHVGHNQAKDMRHLFLTKSQRENIAARIREKVPYQEILNEVRDSITNCGRERIHLLTKKDLCNIENSFNLKGSSVSHANDAVSMEDWVDELETSDYVPFYKPQDSPCEEHSELNIFLKNPQTEDNLVIAINQKHEDISDEQQQLDEKEEKTVYIEEELLHATSLEEIEAAERLTATLKPTIAAIRSQ